MKRTLLEGAKAIADHVGLQLHECSQRPGAQRRRRLAGWVRCGFPVFLIRGRWYAYAEEIDAWLRGLKERTKRSLLQNN